MIGYAKYFENNNETMSFKVSDKKLLKTYTEIWEKISSLMNKKFDSDSVYDGSNKYIKTKIKSYGDKINANFQGKKIAKKCLPLIMLDSVIRVGKKYYPQTHLEECKYKIKRNNTENLINDDLDSSSSDKESDYESDNDESDNDESANDESND